MKCLVDVELEDARTSTRVAFLDEKLTVPLIGAGRLMIYVAILFVHYYTD
jgi:hypothetical protein